MKKLKLLLLIVTLSALNFSCLVDDEDDGGLQGAQNSPYTLGFNSSNELQSYFVDVGAVNIEIPVNVLGGNSGIALPSDATVSYAIDPSSTATEGNEFSLIGNSFTIPSGTSFGNLPLQINTGGLDPDQPTTLVLKLTSSTGAAVSTINDTYTITFVGCQSDHAGVYSNPDVPSGAMGQATVTELAPNTYRISAMPFLGFGGVTPVEIDFQNVCGEIEWTGWQLGTLVVGPGSFDEATGAITFDFLKIYNGSDVSSGIWFDLGATTYTPL